eukprot:scaffold77736_cov66-Phaeocystis_antarctica.AAC.2
MSLYYGDNAQCFVLHAALGESVWRPPCAPAWLGPVSCAGWSSWSERAPRRWEHGRLRRLGRKWGSRLSACRSLRAQGHRRSAHLRLNLGR